ncbi:hypothetical protein QIR00_gp4 [ssRNA phage Esthiorhiza.2_12]|uniref:Uncharacterized protein n=2 Tax=Leviviricetes TaxID=2842243 RepID=A0A8S5L0G5_9VIRU|nr:hypothetical protein QIR00_gp4 [ssRNA phage Esthiorhiza.2_12]QDH91530.1 MAG: hypothetical protein H2RhizoLitter491231_000001 [Leviviridae sp.]DAD51414.1 TPA_asm: hypothetical protein [ssRNA phage Esthiorhiza.2_12]
MKSISLFKRMSDQDLACLIEDHLSMIDNTQSYGWDPSETRVMLKRIEAELQRRLLMC